MFLLFSKYILNTKITDSILFGHFHSTPRLGLSTGRMINIWNKHSTWVSTNYSQMNHISCRQFNYSERLLLFSHGENKLRGVCQKWKEARTGTGKYVSQGKIGIIIPKKTILANESNLNRKLSWAERPQSYVTSESRESIFCGLYQTFAKKVSLEGGQWESLVNKLAVRALTLFGFRINCRSRFAASPKLWLSSAKSAALKHKFYHCFPSPPPISCCAPLNGGSTKLSTWQLARQTPTRTDTHTSLLCVS